jgi:hypothetical protein
MGWGAVLFSACLGILLAIKPEPVQPLIYVGISILAAGFGAASGPMLTKLLSKVKSKKEIGG